MAILTHKEYSDLEKGKDKILGAGDGIEPPPAPVIKTKRIEYHLFHPDNQVNGCMNKKYHVQIGGKKFEYDIINGVIITDDEEVKLHLISQGFVFMYKKEIE